MKESKREKQKIKERFRLYKWIKAPTNFSLINNTEETVSFINTINNYFQKGQRVFIDLEHVEEIGHGAIVVLLAKMVQFKTNNILFNGNFPKKGSVSKIIKESGFFDNLYKKFNVQDSYDLSPISDSIYTHAQKNVNSKLTESIIKKASTSVWGDERRCTGLQRVFIELMQNTNNHASFGDNGEKHWWMSINYKKSENKVCFSFLDFGVGIFESLANKREGSKFYGVLDRLKRKLNLQKNSELLKLLLTGEVHKTASGHYYRGKGLPGVFDANENNAISHLKIISNDAYGDTSNNIYRQLNNKFVGTFFYWELNEYCKNIKDETDNKNCNGL